MVTLTSKDKRQFVPGGGSICLLVCLSLPGLVLPFLPFSAVSLFFFRPVESVQEGSRRGGEG